MKTKKRQKLCYNCEAEVDLDVIVCPFCAADLREEKPEQQIPSYNPSATLKNLNTQQSLYPSQKGPSEEMRQDESHPVQTEEEAKTVIGPLLLLTLGAQLLLLGFFMLLFSSKGALTLKWDARLWYIYILAATALLIFGTKSVKKL